MNISTKESGKFLIVELHGRLDTTQSDAAEKTMLEILEKGHHNLIMDCGQLEYISSSGLRVFLIVQKKIMAASGSLQLCKMQPTIREIFDISGFSTIFTIRHSLDEALLY